uniref:Uncharacterized protein n=1 Tax=Romanomermis culicivorax TaxID=13658 RepID=A0A915JE43_ROMCU
MTSMLVIITNLTSCASRRVAIIRRSSQKSINEDTQLFLIGVQSHFRRNVASFVYCEISIIQMIGYLSLTNILSHVTYFIAEYQKYEIPESQREWQSGFYNLKPSVISRKFFSNTPHLAATGKSSTTEALYDSWKNCGGL